MAYVSVPRDFAQMKSRLVLHLTKRQLICFSIGGAVAAGIFFATRPLIGQQSAMMLIVFTLIPFFILSMYEKDGLPAEKHLKYYLRKAYYHKPIRRFKLENKCDYIPKEDSSERNNAKKSKP